MKESELRDLEEKEGETGLVSDRVLFCPQYSHAQRIVIKFLTNEAVKHFECFTCLKTQLGTLHCSRIQIISMCVRKRRK